MSREYKDPPRPREPEHDCESQPHSPRPSKIVERAWYFDRDKARDPCGHDTPDGGECEPPPCQPSGHPTRPPGVSTGRLDDGGPLTRGDINAPNVPGVWVGNRSQMDMPYLFMRANAGDLGARPVVGAPFWESPDIIVLPGVTPALAPPRPPPEDLGSMALAGSPNTIYAHVWNFGQAAAHEVVVEFYWMAPSLVITEGLQFIAQTFTSLGGKRSNQCHGVVKCPVPWVPNLANGAHECMLVRVWDNTSDVPGEPKFDAAINRHVAQRNIHVSAPPAAVKHSKALAGTPALNQPMLLRVGPLYGQPAHVSVARVAPNAVPWLQLHTGKRGLFPAMAPPTGVPTLSPPTTAGGGFPSAAGAAQQQVHGDDQHVAFNTTDHAPGPGQAHVYRVTANQGGTTYGGYTVVLLG